MGEKKITATQRDSQRKYGVPELYDETIQL